MGSNFKQTLIAMQKEEFWEIYSQFAINAGIIIGILFLLLLGFRLWIRYEEWKLENKKGAPLEEQAKHTPWEDELKE